MSGEVEYLMERILSDLVDEELDVSPSDEGLASALEDYRANVVATVQFVDGIAQLSDEGDVERIHCLWPIETYGCDASSYLDVHVRELEGRVPAREPIRQFQARLICIRPSHPCGLGNANAVGYLEGAARPAKPYLRTSVYILHGADSLIHDL